jgi:hypothetical protein
MNKIVRIVCGFLLFAGCVFYYAYQQLSDINVYNYGERTKARVEYINSFRRKINAEPKFYAKYQFLADGKLYKNQVRFFPEFEGV